MILLAVVLFFVFVGPLLLETVRRVRVVNARERRRRALNRDQRIRELEADLRIGLEAEPFLPDTDPRVVVVAQMPNGPRPRSHDEAWKSIHRRWAASAGGSESSDKLEVF